MDQQILGSSEAEKLLKKLMNCISFEDVFIPGNSMAERYCFFCVANSPLHEKDCIYLEIFDYFNRKDTKNTNDQATRNNLRNQNIR